MLTAVYRKARGVPLPAALLAVLWCAAAVAADGSLSVGIWGTYQYLPGEDSSTNSGGEFTGEALILYADGKAPQGEGRWLYSAEMRFGSGSFTDTDNNSTGDQMALHKAWVGWRLDDAHTVRVGKSQVPFGWKTVNFWPGDMLLAGYGDQMDVGVKLSSTATAFDYDLAYYLSDDWGGTSTDTVDDNGHWGSSTTYRKVQTAVANIAWHLTPGHSVGLSLQKGQLQDLSGPSERPSDGSHEAAVLYYKGQVGAYFFNASWITNSRRLPRDYRRGAGLPDDIKNTRLAAELGYNAAPWSFYLDASSARPKTDGNNADTVTAYAPGMRYDYGPGWVYVEYLWQNGDIDRNGEVAEGNFDALYISMDLYF